MAWGRICRPKLLGDLGIVDLARFSAALRLRWLWLERVVEPRPWRGLPIPCSLSDRAIFATASVATIGNRERASFWFHSWIDGRAPFLLAPSVFAASRRKHWTVRDALPNNKWVLDVRGRIQPDMLHEFVSLWSGVSQATTTPGTQDTFNWRLTKNGLLSGLGLPASVLWIHHFAAPTGGLAGLGAGQAPPTRLAVWTKPATDGGLATCQAMAKLLLLPAMSS